jgi:hypothetical protein
MEKHHLRMVVSLLFVSCLTACGGGGGSSLPAVGSATNPILSVAGAPSTKKPLTSPAAVTLLDIDCGSTVPVGPWSADADYTMTGAQGTHVVTSAINTAAVSNPPPPAVYQTQRYATHLTYKIPNLVANATYTVRLDFVESFYLAAGQRVFGVAINGTQALTNFDIFATAGGSNIAVAKQFTVAADATGAITIAMNATVNNATISGIEITAGSAATPTPVPTATASPSAVISIDSGSSTADGSFVADTDYSAPGWSSTTVVTNAINTSLIANPAPQAVYQSQRYGPAFTYTIPKLTPNGTYAVRLHFVESFFTSAGSRVFNILVNGNTVYSGLDLFKEAGGANIAIVKQFAVVANSAGTITVTLNATVNNAAIAGLEVFPGNGSLASPTPQPSTTPTPKPSPTPSASPTPIASGDTLPWVWTQLWSAASPMRLTVATQKALGAAVVPHTYMDSLWNQGTAFNTTAQQIPIYVARSSDPVLTVTCTDYGGGCDASGVHVHVPSYAQPQGGQLSGPTSDRHMTVIDEYSSSGPIEVDCWQTQLPGNGVLSCSWAGLFALGGLGTDNGGEGVHFGRPVSTYFLSGQEIANGHIDHPLGINAVCLNSPNLYPAQTFTGTDTACNGGGSNPPHYGNLIHLLWSPTQIAASAYSQPCKVVLTALATYGAYLDDTGDTGNQMRVENELTYTANPATASLDPWPQIQSQMNAAGDGSGSSWSSCLNRLTSGDFEMLQDAPA